MASRYTDVISYKANIEQIFQTISKQYGKFSNVIDYKENHDDYSISFSYPARGATHGEIVHIRLSSAQKNITTIAHRGRFSVLIPQHDFSVFPLLNLETSSDLL